MIINGGPKAAKARNHLAEAESFERNKMYQAFCGYWIHLSDARSEGLPSQHKGSLCLNCKNTALRRGLWGD